MFSTAWIQPAGMVPVAGRGRTRGVCGLVAVDRMCSFALDCVLHECGFGSWAVAQVYGFSC